MYYLIGNISAGVHISSLRPVCPEYSIKHVYCVQYSKFIQFVQCGCIGTWTSTQIEYMVILTYSLYRSKINLDKDI